MSDCLHCDINDLVQQHIERAGAETVDVVEIAAKMTEEPGPPDSGVGTGERARPATGTDHRLSGRGNPAKI